MKSIFPDKGKDTEEIMDKIDEAREKDMNFSSGRIFGSMCTESPDLAKEVYSRFLESNLGNPGLYPGTSQLEEEVHEAVGSLIDAGDVESLSVGGGTEGNIIALWRARERSGRRKVLLPESAHFSFEKACSLLDMESEYIPLTDDFKMDIEVLKNKLEAEREEIAAVVGIAGTTELGAIDPIEQIGELSEDIYFHVDAAFGGFVIPFLEELDHDLPAFDFEVKGVDSLTLDPHKMGMAPIPLGLFYSREGEDISIDSPYLTGGGQKSIRGTRASASIPAFWAVMHHFGKEGYKNLISACMEKTYYLIDRMEEVGFEPIIEPNMNIASFRYEEPDEMVERLYEKGWNVSRTVHPKGLRFVVMPHVSFEGIDEIVEILSGMI
ncbi:MAG: tyrosine decarboxylase MfnA [Candidatus Thermoplasmatota archaeon]|nr:tyrosine decarboxylase MfnA [Candidatus Thermoplasmatota archaeon]